MGSPPLVLPVLEMSVLLSLRGKLETLRSSNFHRSGSSQLPLDAQQLCGWVALDGEKIGISKFQLSTTWRFPSVRTISVWPIAIWFFSKRFGLHFWSSERSACASSGPIPSAPLRWYTSLSRSKRLRSNRQIDNLCTNPCVELLKSLPSEKFGILESLQQDKRICRRVLES